VTLSVIVPAFNEEKTLPACLRALMAQDEPVDEIIVVDNNSRDRTAEVARAMGARVVRETVQGIGPARDRGFREARGELLGRIDADTIVPRGWARRLRGVFARGGVDALTGPTTFNDIFCPGFWSAAHEVSYFGAHRLLRGYEALFGSNMALTRALWERVAPLVCSRDPLLHEDMDMSFHIRAIGGVIRFEPLFTASISARRVRNLRSLLFEYPRKFVASVRHAPRRRRQRP
jgi:glycosyltransferase involved in cell wall biosynthesis